MDMINIEERKDRAMQLHAQGYNCAQSVLLAFDDELGIDPATAAAVSIGLGGGVGGQGEVCGVVSALAMAEGLLNGADPKRKVEAYRNVRLLSDRFREKSGGAVCCRDLKKPGAARSCDQLICDGVEILAETINARNR